MEWYDYALAAVNPVAAGNLFGMQGLFGKDVGLDQAGRAMNQSIGNASQWANQRPSAPQMGQNPYMRDWNSLIGQLKQPGTPQSDLAFQRASDTALTQARSMSSGGSAGGARQAGMNLAGAQANIAGGYQQAKLAEEMARRQALMNALQGGGNAWFQPNAANLNAQMGSPTNLQQLTSFLSQLGAAGGTIAGAK